MSNPDSDTNPKPLVRPARPFDEVTAGHLLIKVAEELNWNFKEVDKFARRVQHIEYGLDAETEFAAIVSWLGNCRLIHRLDQTLLSSRPSCDVRVPDLFAVFENYGVQFPVLIEVKSERRDELTLSNGYLKTLEDYSAFVRHPLLIAWKPPKLGTWMLFDPRLASRNSDKKFVITWNEALKHNLMGGLAGDFMVDPYPGFGMTIEAKRTGERTPHENGFQALYTTDRVAFTNQHGSDIGQPSQGVQAVLWATMDSRDKLVGDDRIKMEFFSVGGAIHAQRILRSSVGLLKLEHEKIHWLEFAKRLDTVLSRDQLLHDIQSEIGKLFHTLIFQHPIKWPEFIPESIRLKLEPPSPPLNQLPKP